MVIWVGGVTAQFGILLIEAFLHIVRELLSPSCSEGIHEANLTCQFMEAYNLLSLFGFFK